MSDGATKATRYTDQGIKVIVTKNDTEPTFTLSFTETQQRLPLRNMLLWASAKGNALQMASIRLNTTTLKEKRSLPSSCQASRSKGNGHTEHQSTKSRSSAVSGLTREMWNNSCGGSSSATILDTSSTPASADSCEKPHQDSTKSLWTVHSTLLVCIFLQSIKLRPTSSRSQSLSRSRSLTTKLKPAPKAISLISQARAQLHLLKIRQNTMLIKLCKSKRSKKASL